MPLAEINAVKQAYIKLPVGGTTRIDAPCLTLDPEGVALAQLLATRFLIARNGSVSDPLAPGDRADEDGDGPEDDEIDAQWLVG